MSLEIQPSEATCGARIRGIDLRRELRAETVRDIRAAWLNHQVLGFPEQVLTIEDIERFATYFGPEGEDPYIRSIPGHRRVVAVCREPDETTPIFAETWHSDWSFLNPPPAGTILYGSIIPPVGGDTLFSDQYAAYEALPEETKRTLEGRYAIHSARGGYAPQGLYGVKDQGRSMSITYSETAMRTQRQPMVRTHPETGRRALFVNPGYTIGLEGMSQNTAASLLAELFAHQTHPRFVYRHRWQAGLLTLWDNRCLLHRATGGYQGHRRLLYRITVAERAGAGGTIR